MRVISGTARGRHLKELQGMETRPTTDRVKEALFNIVQFELPGRQVLDLFAGTGQLGVEALSRGAARCTFVDQRRDAAALVRENLKLTGLSQQAQVVQADSISFLMSCREKFDVIFLDPPYLTGVLEKAVETVSAFDILREHGIMVCESPLEQELPTLAAPYERGKEYRYGKIKLTVYRHLGRPPMKIAIYPGSFDPVTLGHLNIIKRAAACFDRLIVCVMINSKKQGMFTPEERVELLKKATARFPNVEVDYSDGLLAAYAKRRKAHVVVKGLRAVSDFEQEVQMAVINRKLNPGLETMFLASSEKYTYLSSTIVKEMARYGANLGDFLPREIVEDVNQRMKELQEGKV